MPQLETQRLDRRRVRTRAALLRAGQELLSVRSIDGLSIDDIVAAADVAKGSFYNHFPDKDALAREVAEEARRAVEAFVAGLSPNVEDPAERVARALCAFIRQAAENPMGARLMLRLFHGAGIPDMPMNAGVRADIRAGLDTGRFNALPLEAAVLMAVGVVQIGVRRVLEPEAPRHGAGLARELAAGLLRGLGLDTAAARRVAQKASGDIFVGHRDRPPGGN